MIVRRQLVLEPKVLSRNFEVPETEIGHHLEPWVMLYNTLRCYITDPPCYITLTLTEGCYIACYNQVLNNTCYEQVLYNML